jgi:hypothetical protein
MPSEINGHVWAGARTAVYRPIFLWLNDAASLIARQLASAHPTQYPDKVSALDDARRQLVRALFHGAVYSEGVRWWGNTGAEDPSGPPPIPEPEEWKQIDPGWWSHERYEQYVTRHQQTESDFLFFRPEGSTEKWVPKLPIEQILEDTNVLDIIIVAWDANSFDFKGFEGEEGYARIWVRCADIETHFGIETAELLLTGVGQPVDTLATSEIGQLTETGISERRKTKPPRVRTAVYAWLDDRLQDRGPDWIKNEFNTSLARLYAKTLPTAPGDLGHVRKIMDAWRKERGLTRVSKSGG